MALIKHCVCSKEVGKDIFVSWTRFNLPLKTCQTCGVTHQVVDMDEEEYAKFYEERYHKEFQEERGTAAYKDRYDHDQKIAALRVEKYKEFFDIGMKVLDVGASNGAFVDYLRVKKGFEAWGLDYTEGPLIVHPSDIYIKFKQSTFDLITMHDVLEHFVDPFNKLSEAVFFLKNKGTLIIDSPNFFVTEGHHHWKPIEHLWIYTEEALINMAKLHGFVHLYTDYPIPGKFVLYLKLVK